MQNLVGRCVSRLAQLEQARGRFRLQRNMADNTEELSISRLNNQMNYKRIFYSPEKAVVTIPTIPYEAFDRSFSGTKIKPWAVVDLHDSVRLFTMSPVEHTENPDASIVDTHLIRKENYIVDITVKIDVDRSFHDPLSPKFPLRAETEVTHVGSSSTRQTLSIKHKDTPVPYITGMCDSVLLDKESRLPTPYPAWWQAKYSHLKQTKEKLELPTKTLKSFSSKHECLVEFEHIDHNMHTCGSVYIKFCTNLAFKTVVNGNHLEYFSLGHLCAGVKHMQVFYNSESKFGDTLIIEMFEDSSKVNELYFEIKKRGATQSAETKCCTVVFEFYEPPEQEAIGKL